jgi:hypothetical protein
MIRHTQLRWWQRWSCPDPARRSRARRRQRPSFDKRLRLEELETRQLLDAAATLFSQAVPIALGHAQAGVISQSPTIYGFAVTDSGRLRAEVAPTGGATRLTLLSADGQVLMQSDGQSASNSNDLIDLHVTGSTTGTTYFLEVQGLGTGAGTYQLQTSFTVATPPFQPLSVPVGALSRGHVFNLTRNGIPDLVVANYFNGSVSVLLGRGDGTFAPATNYQVNGEPTDVTAADLTGAGVMDLIVSNILGTLTILPGNGDGTFGAPIQITAGSNPSSVVAGDFAGNGRMDLAVTDTGAGDVMVLVGHGDRTFSAPTHYIVGSGPSDIIAGDFNGDGRPDLATANSNSNTVSVLLGNGNGTFQAARAYAVGQGPHALVAGDFAGNGLLDIATANAGSNDVSFLLNGGAGVFAVASHLSAGASPSGIVAGDFTGDGHLDLAASNQDDGTLSIFLGHGNGTFDAQRKVAVGSTPAFIVAANFRNDGRLDLAHGNLTGQVYVDLGRGDGTFQTLAPTATAAGPGAIASGDFTGNGRLDLAVADNSTNDVAILLGRGDGTFQFGGRYAVGPGPQSIVAADFNRDGKLDLAVTNLFANTVTILMGHGDGTFSAPTTFAAGLGPYDVVADDFTGDGVLDLAVADAGANAVSVLRGRGDGTFTAPVSYSVGLTPLALVAGDFTGNGILDLATANFVGNSVSVLYGRGDGTFGNEVQLAAGSGPYAIVTGDFSGDGILDLATANIYSGTVSVFLGRHGGLFAPQISLAVGASPAHLAVADFNRDGHVDLAVSDIAMNTVTVLLAQGNGQFQPTAPIEVGGGPNGLVAGDFTGDGLFDLATVNFTSSDVSVLLNRGNGTFNSPMPAAIAGGPTGIAGADFNDDGSFDLVTANPTARNVQVYLGNGDGTFRSPLTISLPGEPYAVTTGDFNHDGRPDIAVVDYLTNTVSILLGIGDGTFETPLTFAVGSHPDALVAGDFTGDGILDLAVANYGSGTVSILLGRGDGSFTLAQQIAVGQGPISLAEGDLDGNGALDLVVANGLSHSLSILKGRGNGTFWVAGAVPLGTNPSAVVIADFNGDGRLDIATADKAVNAVSVLLGNGDGTFRAPVRFATGSAPVALAAGYFSGDGHLDLATANNGANDVTVLWGIGNGTFQDRPAFAVGSYPDALLVADLNSDGRADVITTNGLGQPVSVGLSLNNARFANPDMGSHPIRSTPLVGDLTGSGRSDVAILAGNGQILVRLANPGDPGRFSPPIVLNPNPAYEADDLTLITVQGRQELAALDGVTGTIAFYLYAGNSRFVRIPGPAVSATDLMVRIVAGDVNGDGLQDLIVATSGANYSTIKVYLQRLDGTFGPASYDVTVGLSVSDVALAKLSGGPGPDIVVTDAFSGTVHVLLNTPSAPFTIQRVFRTGAGLYGVVTPPNSVAQLESNEAPVALAAGAFAGPATTDLVVLNSGSDQFNVLAGDGHGGLFNPATSPTDLAGGATSALVSGDFNHDGIPDLAILDRTTDQVLVYLGDGKGGFVPAYVRGANGEPLALAAGNAPNSLALADLVGDGNLDLLVGNAEGDVLILQGQGNGTFAPYQRLDEQVTLAVSDQTPDGHPAFALANQALDSISYYGAGSGASFQQGRQDGVLSPKAIELADLSGNGIPDLIVANGGGNDILVYSGLGNGQFGPARSFPVGTDPVSITIADLNGDGIPDLVIANQGSNDVSILYGQGHGADWTLVRGPRLSAGLGPDATVVEDVNGDGVPDILVANSASNDVYLLRGTGRGFFDDTNPVTYQTGVDPVQLFVGHFDNTSGLDLVTLNAGSDDLTFFSDFGPGHSVILGGSDPVAAIEGDFSHDGTSDLIVANADGHFTVLLSGANGPRIANVLAPSGLTNVSDIALGDVEGNIVEVYATTQDQETVIPLSLVIEQIAETTSARVAEAPGRVVSEFSSLTGTELEVVATLTITSADAAPADGAPEHDISATSESTPQVGAPTWAVGHNEESEASEEATAAEASGDPATVERNAQITGVLDTPVQQYLDSSESAGDAVSEVPFDSPLDLFNDRGTVSLQAGWQQVIDEVSRLLHAAGTIRQPANQDKLQAPAADDHAPGRSAEPVQSDEPPADGQDRGPTPLAIGAQGEQRRFDADYTEHMHSEQVVESNRPSLNPEHVLALALGVVSPFLVQERPARVRREEANAPSRRGS